MPCHHFSRGDLLAFYLGWWTGQFPESVSPVHGNCVGIDVLGMGIVNLFFCSLFGPGVQCT